jgi:ferredoxin-nitrite reductase
MGRMLSTPRQFTAGATPEERLKVDKDGLDILGDIHRYAQTGAAIAPGDLALFKWYGLYLQKPKESGYFMLRLRLPGGRLSAAQLRVVAGIADDYAHGFGDITTRQTFQFHWLTIGQVPDILARLDAVGIATYGACGDTGRNVVGCPVAGMVKDEILDATPQLEAVNAHLLHNPEFSNLPRKFKVSLSGCRIHCAQPDINCLGFFGLERTVNGKVEAGFGLKAGGGLSSAPHLARTLPVFLRPDQVLAAAHYATVVFRDFGYREKRNRARLKFLVADWGPDKFLAQMEELGNLRFDRHAEFAFPADPETDHLGIQEQKQPGLYFVGISFAGGRVRGHQLRTLAELAERHAAPGLDRLGATNKQNLILFNIPEKNLPALQADLDTAGLVYRPSNFRSGCVSCTGIEFCNLAIAETKNRMMELVGQLERECGFYRDKIRIHFSGCTSSCGQHQIADIGFRGGLTRVNGVQIECFDMFVGGKLGRDARFNTLLKNKIPSASIHRTIGRLLAHFEAHRAPGELFADYAARIPRDELRQALDAEPL